jgi:hypothetical protein
MKVVYNACYGGFSLSDAAMRRYAEIKGITLYPEKDDLTGHFTVYWTVPKEQRSAILSTNDWHTAPIEARAASNRAYSEMVLGSRDFERDDPVLVRVVEELGDAANGQCAKLKIEDVPAGTLWRIDEYDGNESVATQDSYEWKVAT